MAFATTVTLESTSELLTTEIIGAPRDSDMRNPLTGGRYYTTSSAGWCPSLFLSGATFPARAVERGKPQEASVKPDLLRCLFESCSRGRWSKLSFSGLSHVLCR